MKKSLEKRVLAYVTKVIANSKDNRCGVSVETIRKPLKVRKQSIVNALRHLVEEGKLVRSPADNRNRPNQKYYYQLPSEVLEKEKSEVKSVVPEGEKVVPNLELRELRGNPIKESLPCGSEKLFNRKFDFEKMERSLDRLEQIETYLDAGLHLTPLAEADKVPLKGWTKEKTASMTKSEMLEFFRSNPKCNVGCWLPEEIVVIDVDDYFRLFRNALGLGSHMALDLTGTMRCITGRTEETGMHLWFRNTHGITSRGRVGGFVDYKAGGSLIVLPPSIHKSGRRYVWDKIAEPLDVPAVFADIPEVTPQGDSRESSEATLRKVKRGAVPKPLMNKSSRLEVGERYDELFRLGRSLRFSMNAERLETELRDYNRTCCSKPLDERRLRRLIRDVRFGNNRAGFKGQADCES